MIMPIRTLEPSDFDGLEPGMVITFNFHVLDHESWVTRVTKTGELGEITMETSEAETPKTLKAGAILPDYAFLDENGKNVKLSDFRGMPVAITFVFSRCPVPEYCPRMMSHFAGVLTELSGKPAPFHLLTISFDHEHDNPALLKSWGASFGHREGQPWSILSTADGQTIEKIATDTGLRFGEANGTIQHNLRTLVLNPDGTIRKIFTDESWTVEEMVAEIQAAAETKEGSVAE
jgi:protein SCO1